MERGVPIPGVFMPEASGVIKGVGAFEGACGRPSGDIEYTMIRASETTPNS